ncbi:hypothetical protein D3C84_847860 [compost metagenome]
MNFGDDAAILCLDLEGLHLLGRKKMNVCRPNQLCSTSILGIMITMYDIHGNASNDQLFHRFLKANLRSQ